MDEYLHGDAKREADCKKKKRFLCRKYARKRAKAISRETGRRMHEYQCPICNEYHLTSQVESWKLPPP